MLNFPRWKVLGISLICLIVSLMAVPSFVPASVFSQLPGFAQGSHINLGLDLAGGSQLLLEAQTQDLARSRAEAMEETMRRELRGASPAAMSARWGPWAAPNGTWPRPTAGR